MAKNFQSTFLSSAPLKHYFNGGKTATRRHVWGGSSS